MPMPKGSRHNSDDVVGINWVECDECHRWDIFENSGIPGSIETKKTQKLNYKCRLCKLEERIVRLEGDLTKSEEEKSVISIKLKQVEEGSKAQTIKWSTVVSNAQIHSV